MRPAADLLAAILADPDDAALRMVYADALLAAGDPRGELIALELAGSGTARRNELRRLHGATWWPELATRFMRTRGGFVDAIAVRPAELDGIAPLLAREPIRALEVWAPGLTAAQAARLPVLPALTLRELDTASWEAFLTGPAAAAVEALDIAGEEVTGNVLPACRRLCTARLGWMGGLARWDHIGRLRVLDAPHCDALDAFELIDLLAAAEELAWLRISGCRLAAARGPDLDRALAAHPTLRHVELLDCDLARYQVDALRAAAPAIAICDRAQPPYRLDLVGHVLEVVQDPGGWRIELDREPRALEAALSETYSVWGGRIESTPEHVATVLAILADAIAGGWPRKLTGSGFELVHDPLPRDHRSTFEVTLSEPPAPIGLVHDYYVD